MGAFIKSAAIILSLGIVSSAGYGQDAVQNSETSFYVQTSGGTPRICGVNFTLAYSDHTYRQGALSGVTGSLAWMESKGNVGLVLKIIGADFINTANAVMTPQPFPVRQGFVVVDGKSVFPSLPATCEQPTGFCALYSLQSSVAIFRAISSQQSLAVGFSRRANGLDITLPIDTHITAKSGESAMAFNNCMLALLQRAEANIKK